MNKDNEVIIFHLSDLHRTPGDEVTNNNLWQYLEITGYIYVEMPGTKR